MHIESHGIETGEASRPFIARITIGTRRDREVLAEFESSTLASAEQEAQDWMEEYCARVGLGGERLLTAWAMRSRWDRLRDGMPELPKPCREYRQAVERISAASDLDDWLGNELGATGPARRAPAYAGRSQVVSAVAAARAAKIDVAGIRLWPDGSIAVFDQRATADLPSGREESAGDDN